MTRREFVSELGGIIRLLREHSFLAYSSSGRREYEQKLQTCADYFAYLVFRKTGVPVRALPGLVSIESVRDASYTAGKNLAVRAAKRARALAARATGMNRDYYADCARVWERATLALGEPDPE